MRFPNYVLDISCSYFCPNQVTNPSRIAVTMSIINTVDSEAPPSNRKPATVQAITRSIAPIILHERLSVTIPISQEVVESNTIEDISRTEDCS